MKKQVLRLDPDDTEPDLDEYVFMLFHTQEPGYAFVDDINRLYNFTLARIEDMQLHESEWPLYTYRDSLRKIEFFLVEKPAAAERLMPRWGVGQKLLIARGEDARMCLEKILNDFLEMPRLPDTGDLAAQQRYNILTTFQQSFTTVTLLDIDDDTALPPKAARERSDTRQLLAAMLDYLDINRIG